MVGGTVLQVCDVPNRPDVIWIEVGEKPYNVLDRCGVLIRRDSDAESIELNDCVWWQMGHAYWTPRNKSHPLHGQVDIKLDKVGCSGVTLESASAVEV